MYEDMTMDVIMEEMMEEMPDGLDTSEGSLIYHSCAKHGARLEEVYTELSALVDNQYSDTADPVSYTHLDVYKRQISNLDDPTVNGNERVKLTNCTFDEVKLVDWEANKLGEESIPFTFTTAEMLDTIDD